MSTGKQGHSVAESLAMPTSSRNVHLTPHDVDLLTMLTRYGAATYPLLQATVLHDRRRTSIYRQLNRLASVRLLEDPRTGPSNVGRPRDIQSMWVPTRSAYQLVGSNLRVQADPPERCPAHLGGRPGRPVVRGSG